MQYGGDSIYILLTFVPIIFYLILIIFGIYFVVKVIKFMNDKIKLDKQNSEKLDELIKAIQNKNELP